MEMELWFLGITLMLLTMMTVDTITLNIIHQARIHSFPLHEPFSMMLKTTKQKITLSILEAKYEVLGGWHGSGSEKGWKHVLP